MRSTTLDLNSDVVSIHASVQVLVATRLVGCVAGSSSSLSWGFELVLKSPLPHGHLHGIESRAPSVIHMCHNLRFSESLVADQGLFGLSSLSRPEFLQGFLVFLHRFPATQLTDKRHYCLIHET